MTTKTDESTAMQVFTDPETGELIEVNLDNASQPEAADLREAKKLHQIMEGGPFAIFGVRIEPGVTFDKEYASFPFLQKPGKMEIGVTSSAEVIQSLKRIQARGLATPNAPALVKAEQAKTSSGYYVHKLVLLSKEEEAGLRAALKAGA